jgi:hypothetical protein
MIDPGLIVLGGGVGQNPLLLAEVSKVVRQLSWPTEIAASPLGSRGSVIGASQLAVRQVLQTLTGSNVIHLDGRPAASAQTMAS